MQTHVTHIRRFATATVLILLFALSGLGSTTTAPSAAHAETLADASGPWYR